MILFEDRLDAGKQLAKLITKKLKSNKAEKIPVVYALPRGGIPVGAAIAQELCCPLSIIVSKKISLPSNPELALGATTADGHTVWCQSQFLQSISGDQLKEAFNYAQQKALKQWEFFAEYCPEVDFKKATAILVDDGIATGMTMAAAAIAIKKLCPQQLWIAAPVAPKELIHELKKWGDKAIILDTPHPFLSVSRFYRFFPQVSSKEALEILKSHKYSG